MTTTPSQLLETTHRLPARGSELALSSPLYRGRYGRMFRRLPSAAHSLEDLRALGEALTVEADASSVNGGWSPPPSSESTVDAGYTYLGQFIDHDITFDPVSSLQRQNDPEALVNFRTPRLDLDSVYGRGPADDPFLYEKDGLRLRLGREIGPNGSRDLPRDRRSEEGSSDDADRALIGDPRNDENKIVAQLHAVFIRFHNAVLTQLEGEGLSGTDLFKRAQRTVRWHYQWLVLHDFLPTILGGSELGSGIVNDLFTDVLYRSAPDTEGGALTDRHLRRWQPVFYDPHEQPYIPLEFSVAAYRFGHSMIRGAYRLNDDEFPGQPVELFNDGPTVTNLNGVGPIPGNWGIRWKHFFGSTAQQAMKIDASLVSPWRTCPVHP